MGIIWYIFADEKSACAPYKMIHKNLSVSLSLWQFTSLLVALQLSWWPTFLLDSFFTISFSSNWSYVLVVVGFSWPTDSRAFHCPFSLHIVDIFRWYQAKHAAQIDFGIKCCSRLFQTEFKTISFASAFGRIYRSTTFFGVVRNIKKNVSNTPRGANVFWNVELMCVSYKYVLIIVWYVCVCVKAAIIMLTINVDFETFPDQFSENWNFPRKQINLKQF